MFCAKSFCKIILQNKILVVYLYYRQRETITTKRIKKMKKVTKKQIAQDMTSFHKMAGTYYHEYYVNGKKYSLTTVSGCSTVEQITDEEGNCLGYCATKKEFIDFIYNLTKK